MDQADRRKEHVTGSSQTDCEAVDVLIAAYSLGTIDPDEVVFIQQHLANCPEVLDRLAEYRRLVEVLHYSAPLVQPPPRLRERLRAAIHQSERRVLPVGSRLTSMRCRKTFTVPRVLVAIMVILCLLFSGSTFYWISQVDLLRSRYDQLTSLLERQTQALMMVSSSGLQRIMLPGTGVDAPQGVLLCDPRGTIGLLQVENLSTFSQYEVWLSQGNQSVNIGAISPDNKGTALAVIHSPQRMDSFHNIAIVAVSSGKDLNTPILQGPLYMDGDATP